MWARFPPLYRVWSTLPAGNQVYFSCDFESADYNIMTKFIVKNRTDAWVRNEIKNLQFCINWPNYSDTSNFIFAIYIYVWIFENGVEFGAKRFRLPAGDSDSDSGAWKARGASVKEDWGRKHRSLATSLYQGRAPGFVPWGWGGSQRGAFCSVKVLIFFAGQPWPDMPCRLSGQKPASQSDTSKVGE